MGLLKNCSKPASTTTFEMKTTETIQLQTTTDNEGENRKLIERYAFFNFFSTDRPDQEQCSTPVSLTTFETKVLKVIWLQGPMKERTRS